MEEKDSFDYSRSSHCCKKKKILVIIAITFVAFVILTAIFLIGCLKFGWFKKSDDDRYDLDVKIKRTVNQVDYFTETKKIKSKVAYTSGELEEQEQIIDTNFAVILTDKTDKFNSQNNMTIKMNNATLVILDSKVKYGGKETKLNSFNIFDEEQIKEFELNPSGATHPIAKFSYFENGTIIVINLPEDMDQYNAQAMIELINNVIPKLSRSKKEDKKRGVYAVAKKTRNGDTITEVQTPKEYEDKFTGEEYKGSKFGKKTEVDVENEKIKKVSTNTNLFLETQKENNETVDFGLQNFTYDIDSEIKSTKNEINKEESVQLIKKLTEKLKFIKSDDLMESLLLKEKEKNKELDDEEEENFKRVEKKQKNETNEENSEIESNNSKQVRKLLWEGSFSRSWALAHSNILGKTVTLKYEISLSDGGLSNVLIVACGYVELYFGNTGTRKDKHQPETRTGDKQLFKIPFPGTPIPVMFSFKLGGSFSYDVSFDVYSKEFSIAKKAEFYAKAELGAGIDGVAEISVGAQGTLIGLAAESTFTWKGRYYVGINSIVASGCKINCYVAGRLMNRDVFKVSKDFLDGWEKRINY